MGQIARRDELELLFGKRVLELTRAERSRLIVLLGYPPNPVNVPEAFWQNVGKEVKSRILVLLGLIFRGSAIQHGMEPTIASSLSHVWAGQHAETVVANWIKRSTDLLQSAQQKWDAQEKPPTSSDARELSDTILGPDRIGILAATETTVAQTAGAEQAVNQAGGISDDDLWFTRDDGKVCTVCRPLHETPRSFWSQYVPAGPPAHPNCRCYLLYRNLDEIRNPPSTGPRPAPSPAPAAPVPPISFKPHMIASVSKGSQTVYLDPKKLEASWAKDGSFYIPPEGGGAEIPGRIEGFQQFLTKGVPVEQPLVAVGANGQITISDGRHRTRVLLNMGLEKIPVSVEKRDVERIKKIAGAE